LNSNQTEAIKFITNHSNPNALSNSDLKTIKEWIVKYPYCQSLHFLAARSAINTLEYPTFLAQAAAIAPSRSILYSIIHHPEQFFSDISSILEDDIATENEVTISEIEIENLNVDEKSSDNPFGININQIYGSEFKEEQGESSLDKENEEESVEEILAIAQTEEEPVTDNIEVEAEEEKIVEEVLAVAETEEEPVTENIEVETEEEEIVEEVLAVAETEEEPVIENIEVETEEEEIVEEVLAVVETEEELVSENIEVETEEEEIVEEVLAVAETEEEPVIENIEAEAEEEEIVEEVLAVAETEEEPVIENIEVEAEEEEIVEEVLAVAEIEEEVVLENTEVEAEEEESVEEVTAVFEIEEVPVSEDAEVKKEEVIEEELTEEPVAVEEKVQKAEKEDFIFNYPIQSDFFALNRKAPIEKEAEKTEDKSLSQYNDERMPYTFLWWLNKTRKEHSTNHQPYSSFKLDTSKQIKKEEKDHLNQQIAENIFHIRGVEELSAKTPNFTVPFDFRKKEFQIIEKFIKEEPTIKPPTANKIDSENKAKRSSEDANQVVSETLAKIYVEQMLYHKALDVYRKLSLKYPEKSTYFASQIKYLELKVN
jgi:hypothetical protein